MNEYNLTIHVNTFLLKQALSTANCGVFLLLQELTTDGAFSFKEQSHSARNYHWYSGKNKSGNTVATVQSALLIFF